MHIHVHSVSPNSLIFASTPLKDQHTDRGITYEEKSEILMSGTVPGKFRANPAGKKPRLYGYYLQDREWD